MKAVILAGGFGTRLSEETSIKPKPMLNIGGKPILWHIMKTYSHHGINEFVILLGYKGYVIKEYFANYFLHQSDVTIDMSNGDMQVHNNSSESWKVTLLDTGVNAMTGARVKKAKKYIGNETFLLTYGDGVGDIDIAQTLKFHLQHKRLMTMTSAQPEGRFGALNINENNQVTTFEEKPKGDGSWVNAGYFICQPEVLDYIADGDDVTFEQEPLRNLAQDGQIYSYKHKGFWMPMDTLRDKIKLNEMCESGNAPWIIWDK
ncbi:glucose-1-phosphate cytidylyltransferase [Candidatus Thioglobus sp.]|nr:glucose-1-phosphate cytidylyltransferase [Candidatus Thioglobus sp.]MDC1165337.1 glucose-1-phosphate cytidylyltransferase [Candidatus Thioglobus sp.]